MLTIYSEKISIRLMYTCSIIFEDRKIAYRITDNIQDFANSSFPKLAYDVSKNWDCPTIRPSPLLFEKEIQPHHLDKTNWFNEEILQVDNQADVLSSIFYVLSLYDEYLQKEKDNHGRNKAQNSILLKMGWLEKLVVERWAEALIQFIEESCNCNLNAHKLPFTIIPTFDIDNAFAYQHKIGWRLYLGLMKDILFQNTERIKERKEVLAKEIKDPFDTFDTMKQIAEKGYEVKVFWLLGKYGKYDKNIDAGNKAQKEKIRAVDSFAEVGLHPSYASNEREERLQTEKNHLEEILKRKIDRSRQHFLKIIFPTTYRRLQHSGFTHDYSLGFADYYGFRAGITRPFLWFDLPNNEVSKLILHPITYMDGTLKDYLKLSIEEALTVVRNLKNEVYTYGGEFISLWHNHTIDNYGDWKGWKEVLEYSLKRISNEENGD